VVGYTAAVVYWTRNSGVPSRVASVAAFLSTIFNAAALLVAGVIGAVLLVSTRGFHANTSRGVFLSTLVIACIGGAAVLIVAFILRRRSRMPWLARLDRTIAQWRDSMAQLAKGAWKRPAIAAVLNIGFDIATLALIFTAAGARLDLMTLLAGYGLPLLVSQAAPVPGGAGVTEVSMSALYVSLGVQPSAAVVSVLAYRLVSFWLPTLLGIPLILRLQAVRRPRAYAAQPAPGTRNWRSIV
jgi:hypothetical protein